MNARRLFFAALAAFLLTCTLSAKALAQTETDGNGRGEACAVSAECAALLEMQSGRVIYFKNAHSKAYMASTTKIMTALLAAEYGGLDALVPVPDAAVGVEGSSIYLARGECLSLSDLLYGLMLVSGNDAAVTIATHIGGNTKEFAALMNARAQALGCEGTHFSNPNGLPDENHYTTALDLAKIAAAAMQNETFRTVVATTYHQTTTGDRMRTFKNKNKLLWQYAGGNGVKTGFTKAAGRCLVFSAERGGMTLVGVALNAPQMWDDAAALLDYGFATVEQKKLVDAERPLAQVAVEGGAQDRLSVYPSCDVFYPMARDGSDTVAWELSCTDALNAPVAARQEAGALTLRINGVEAGGVPLVVKESVPRARLLDYLRTLTHSWCA